MAKALSVFAVIMAVACVTVFIFAGIYGSEYTGKISDIHMNALENAFTVEYLIVEDYYGEPKAVLNTAEGLYLDADEFIDDFKDGSGYVTSYTVEDGKIVNQETLVVTFTNSGNKLANLLKIIPQITTNAQAD